MRHPLQHMTDTLVCHARCMLQCLLAKSLLHVRCLPGIVSRLNHCKAGIDLLAAINTWKTAELSL